MTAQHLAKMRAGKAKADAARKKARSRYEAKLRDWFAIEAEAWAKYIEARNAADAGLGLMSEAVDAKVEWRRVWHNQPVRP